MVKVVAFDLSLTGTGVCDRRGETYVIRPGTRRGLERLAYIRSLVLAAMSAGAPAVAVLEGYSYGSKGRAAVSLGELGGVVRYALYQTGVVFVDVPPACRTKYATGKGNASKDAVLQQAVLRSGHTFDDNNAADAWWLWQMGLAAMCPAHPLLVQVPQVNQAALERVQWPLVGARQQ